MTAMTANLVLQTLILVAGAEPYAEAHKTTAATGRPLLVLVGADWCPACQTMKKSTLARMEKQGKLKQVSFTVINTDNEPTLSQKIMRGTSIPQLVLFEKVPEGWRRTQITGAASEGDVEAFISRAVEQHTRLARQKSNTDVKSTNAGGGQ